MELDNNFQGFTHYDSDEKRKWKYKTQTFVIRFRFPWRQLLWVGARVQKQLAKFERYSPFWDNIYKECIKHQIRIPVEEPCSTKIYFRPSTSPKN